jgi:subtilisin family serine protease
MSVGSTDNRDNRSNFSTYGSTLDIAAPGSDILSSSKSGGYETMSGTSMASPHVAGAAGLLFSLHPTWTVAQVRQALESTGDPVNGFAGSSIKRMNVARALGATATAPAPSTPAADKAAPTLSGMIASIGTTSAAVSWKTNEAADTQIEIGLTNPPTSRSAFQPAMVTSHSVKLANLTPGKRYYFRARSRDKAGNLGLSATYTLTTRAR